MDKEMEEYYIEMRDLLREKSIALKVEFLDAYIEQIERHAPDIYVHIDMDTIYNDTPSNLWTEDMYSIYNDARYNYQQLQLVEMYCPEE